MHMMQQQLSITKHAISGDRKSQASPIFAYRAIEISPETVKAIALCFAN
jgi:hypothetical protein